MPADHEEFLERESGSALRHEYRQGRVEMTAGGSRNHSLIGVNVAATLRQAVASRNCEVHGGELLIRIAKANLSTYADAMVICGPPSYCDRRRNIVDNPVVLVEVLSPSTAAYDRGEKFEAYKLLDSLQEYVLIAQDMARVERFARKDGWRRAEFAGLHSSVELESLAASIPLAEIYRLIDWEAPE